MAVTIEVQGGRSVVVDTSRIGPKGDPGEKGAKGDQGVPGDTGEGVPAGGGVASILGKATGDDYDTEWVGRASQAQAQAGASNSVWMTPSTTKDAILEFSGLEVDDYDGLDVLTTSVVPTGAFVRTRYGGAVLQGVASGVEIVTAGGAQLAVVRGPEFTNRTAATMGEIAKYPDGTIGYVAGVGYVADSSDPDGYVRSYGGARLGTIAELTSFDRAADGDTIVVWSGFNGEAETFTYDADSVLTADGALVVNATGMGSGRYISKRTVFEDFAEFIGDLRTFADGTVLTINNVTAAYTATSSSGTLSQTNAGGQEFDVWSMTNDIRAFGLAANGSTDDTSKILAALGAGFSYGGGATCAVTELEFQDDWELKDINLVGTSSSGIVIKVGDVGAGALYDNSGIKLENIKISGVGSYAVVFSNVVTSDIKNVTVTGFTATNDIFYLHRLYACTFNGLRCLGGSTAGASGAFIRLNLGVNGVSFDGVYSSCFIKYGVVIDGASNSISFNSPTLQGHSTAWEIPNAYGVTINSPYTENCVNSFVFGSGANTPRSIKVVGAGHLGGYTGGHTFAADDNLVLVMVNRGAAISFDDCYFIGVTSAGSGKRLASVNNGAVLVLRDPLVATGDLTDEITDYLYKQSGALATSGYYVEATGAGGHNTERTIVSRSNQGSNSHVIEYRTTGTSSVSETLWTPPDNV